MRDQLVIESKNLSFAYEAAKKYALSDVNIKIKSSQIVALMGGSGSGKSTFLKLVCGLLSPDSPNALTVMGQDMHNISTHNLNQARLQMGVLFQSNGLFTDMSLLENVMFPLLHHSKLTPEKMLKRAEQSLYEVGLDKAKNMRPLNLSGGMARRLALARATVLNPTLVLYDEPFAGLDPISLNVIKNLIRSYQEQHNTSSLLITHQVQETFEIADYVYMFWAGNLIAEGTPDELNKSTSPYVKQFITGAPDGPLPFHFDPNANQI